MKTILLLSLLLAACGNHEGRVTFDSKAEVFADRVDAIVNSQAAVFSDKDWPNTWASIDVVIRGRMAVTFEDEMNHHQVVGLSSFGGYYAESSVDIAMLDVSGQRRSLFELEQVLAHEMAHLYGCFQLNDCDPDHENYVLWKTVLQVVEGAQ